jgi:hypothetical protein
MFFISDKQATASKSQAIYGFVSKKKVTMAMCRRTYKASITIASLDSETSSTGAGNQYYILHSTFYIMHFSVAVTFLALPLLGYMMPVGPDGYVATLLSMYMHDDQLCVGVVLMR